MDTPIPNELLDSVDVLSSNETELSLLTGKHTETFEQFSQDVAISERVNVSKVSFMRFSNT
ncbi:unnamed protein product [Brassica rapa]|uniref:Ribokinase n=1 Tax=Brassica campestris TaxID=3711 RepID=A0A8D9HA95_BRACM|nr:unnamed protein product [Brassica rapa]